MTDILTTPVGPRMAWTGADLEMTDGWIDEIGDAERAELRAASQVLPADPSAWPRFGREQAPLRT